MLYYLIFNPSFFIILQEKENIKKIPKIHFQYDLINFFLSDKILFETQKTGEHNDVLRERGGGIFREINTKT